MKYYCYILFSPTSRRTYTGISNDVQKRLKEHNTAHQLYTKKFGPWEILHIEEFSSRSNARQREKYFKSSAGHKKIALFYSEIV